MTADFEDIPEKIIADFLKLLRYIDMNPDTYGNRTYKDFCFLLGTLINYVMQDGKISDWQHASTVSDAQADEALQKIIILERAIENDIIIDMGGTRTMNEYFHYSDGSEPARRQRSGFTIEDFINQPPIPSVESKPKKRKYVNKQDEFEDYYGPKVRSEKIRRERELLEREEVITEVPYEPVEYFQNYDEDEDQLEDEDINLYIFKLIQRRDHAFHKIEKLNPKKKKDSKKIAVFKHRIFEVEQKLEDLRMQGIFLPKDYKKVSLWDKVVKGVKTIGKKIKRFFKRNSDTIWAVLTGLVAPIAWCFFNRGKPEPEPEVDTD